MKKLALTFGFVLLLALLACSSKELSRSSAKSIINSSKRHVTVSVFTEPAYFLKGDQFWNVFSALQQLGYAIVTPSSIGFKAHFTDKMPSSMIVHKQGDSVDLSLGDIVADDITGISDAPMSQGYKVADFTGHVKLNELGELIVSKSKTKNGIRGNAEFKKYDDGWRLEKLRLTE